MRALWSVLLFLVLASVALAQTDLQLTSSPSQTTGLWLHDQVILTTTVRNSGPGTAPAGSVYFSGEVEEASFGLPSSDTPACDLDTVEFEPPRLNFMWAYPALTAGAEFRCVLRLRVFNQPEDGLAELRGIVEPLNDPVAANNAVVLNFSFGTTVTATRQSIPTTSHAGIMSCIAGILAMAWLGLAKNSSCVDRYCVRLSSLGTTMFDKPARFANGEPR